MPDLPPYHPGAPLTEGAPPALNMDFAELAKYLRFSQKRLTLVALGLTPVTPVLAKRLELAGISTARLWLAMQADYDRRHAQYHERQRR